MRNVIQCTSTSQICSHVNGFASCRDGATHARLCMYGSGCMAQCFVVYALVRSSVSHIECQQVSFANMIPSKMKKFQWKWTLLCVLCVLLTLLSSYIEFVQRINGEETEHRIRTISTISLSDISFVRIERISFWQSQAGEWKKKRVAQRVRFLCIATGTPCSKVWSRLQCYRHK